MSSCHGARESGVRMWAWTQELIKHEREEMIERGAVLGRSKSPRIKWRENERKRGKESGLVVDPKVEEEGTNVRPYGVVQQLQCSLYALHQQLHLVL